MVGEGIDECGYSGGVPSLITECPVSGDLRQSEELA
jgi:hypothetical protein